MHTRAPIALVLVASSIFLTSAKCIENDGVSRRPNGNLVIFGEIHNETDIQGIDMELQGALLDENGNVLASPGVGVVCPRELSPGSLSAFGVFFDNSSGLPEPADHRVNVSNGKTLEQPLPTLNLSTSGTANKATNGDVALTIKYTVTQAYSAALSLCIAMYDTSGTVIGLVEVRPVPAQIDLTQPGVEQTHVRQLPAGFNLVPPDATHLRYWLWLQSPSNASVSDHQSVVSALIPIERRLQLEPATAP